METALAKDRAAWRRWLAKNFNSRDEIWLVFYKKASGKQGVSYEHAVEEALCFGWIDGRKKKLDEECMVEIKSPARGAADCGGQDDAGGTENV
jgi:uncharacterized protein YdeI (YjbR/CyaY-like superfamily)